MRAKVVNVVQDIVRIDVVVVVIGVEIILKENFGRDGILKT